MCKWDIRNQNDRLLLIWPHFVRSLVPYLKVQFRLYLQHFIFFISYEWAWYSKVLHNNRLERLSRDKHSSLFDPFVRYEESVLWILFLTFVFNELKSDLSGTMKCSKFYINDYFKFGHTLLPQKTSTARGWFVVLL